ncbi:MAG: hypothetical protein Q3994_06820 [Prevotella sp.]|nr:hypothetical protein [Prevotella sp.]
MKRLVVFICSCFIAVCTFAQQTGERPKFDPEQFKVYLHEFIAKEVRLTEKEQELFFPIFDACKEQERALFAKQKRMWKKPQTENDCREAIKAYDEIDLKLKQLQTNYHKKALKVLSPSKVLKVIRAEEKFRSEMFRHMAWHFRPWQGWKHPHRPMKR